MMGLFRKIFSKIVTAPANLITTVLEKATGETYARTSAEEFATSTVGKVLSTAALVTAIPLAVAKAPAIIGSVAKGFGRLPLIQKLGAVVLVGGATISPTIRKTIVGTPEFLFEKGQEIGELVEELPEEEKLETGTVLGLIGGALIGAGVTKAVEKIQEGKELVKEIPAIFPVQKEKELGKEGEIPILPETTKIITGKAPSKRRRAKITPSVRQYVKINIINKPTSKSYLNQALFH